MHISYKQKECDIMYIKYSPPIRLRDVELHQKMKIRAAQENKTLIQMVEKMMKDYLKKPIDRA